MALFDIDSVTIDKAAHPGTKLIFKDNWESAKAALTAIAALVKNPIAKTVIQLVITLGDALKSKL